MSRVGVDGVRVAVDYSVVVLASRKWQAVLLFASLHKRMLDCQMRQIWRRPQMLACRSSQASAIKGEFMLVQCLILTSVYSTCFFAYCWGHNQMAPAT